MPFRPVIVAALQAAGLYAAGIVVPLLGQFAIFFVPVPLITVTVLEGRQSGLLATVLAAGMVAALGSWQSALLLFLLGFGLMALGLSEGLLRGMRPESAILAGGALPVLALLAIAAPVLLQSGKSPVAITEEFLRQSIVDGQKIYTDLGLTEVAQTIGSLSDSLVFYVARLIPGLIAMTMLLQAAGCYGLSRALILRRRPGHGLAAGPAFATWHAPDQWVWPLIATLAVIALAPHGSALWFAGLNVAVLFLLVYTAQGAAVLEFYYRKARIPTVLRSFFHAVILALPTLVLVVALGVVDIWADLRKVRAAEKA